MSDTHLNTHRRGVFIKDGIHGVAPRIGLFTSKN